MTYTDATPAWFNELLDRFVKPHVETLAKIAYRREIAVIVAEDMAPMDAPGEPGFLSAECRETLRRLGWDGHAPVFEMPRAVRRSYAESIVTSSGDTVTHRWLTRPGLRKHLRLLVFAHSGTLLLNYTPRDGWHLEPGSTDAERTQAMH